MDLSAASLSLPMDTRLWWGGGVRAADTTAQFKEMEQEMWADSEQSSLYVYLSWAWENSGQSRLCLFFQAGRQVYVQVLHSATQALVCNVFAGGVAMNNVPYISMAAERWWMQSAPECTGWKYHIPACRKEKKRKQTTKKNKVKKELTSTSCLTSDLYTCKCCLVPHFEVFYLL